MNSGTKVMIISLLLAIVCPVILGQVDPNCNYAQNMRPGDTYYVYNNEYPNYYGRNKKCRWILNAPDDYNIVLFNCELVMPVGHNCDVDQFKVSLDGNTNLDGPADYIFCGNTTIPAMESKSNSLAIGLITSPYTDGGRFLCLVKAKERFVPHCECGFRDTRRIVGGIETGPNEFPMMAAIINVQNIDVLCGATIISEHYVVTAAHCVKHHTVDSIILIIGAHNLTSEEGIKIKINKIIIHDLYDPNNEAGDYDIAVLRTQEPMVGNDRTIVTPVCLPFRYYRNSFANQRVEVIGWGTTEFTGPKSEVLLKTDLNVLSKPECYNRTRADQTKMCTFKEGHDSCQSDSGGPVLWKDSNSRSQLVGIISYGRGCATDYPGVNTRVTDYLLWIQYVTPEVCYCKI